MDCKQQRRACNRRGVAAAIMAALGLAGTIAELAAQPTSPPRDVVSINLCTDQLVMALAEPGTIRAVSRLARSELSFEALRARSIPLASTGAEHVLSLRPDLVLAGAYSGAQTRAMLHHLGIRVETFAPVATLAEARAEIERAAALLGTIARATSLLAEIDRALEAAAGAGRGLTAIVYERRGFASGTGTLSNELLAWLGVEDLAARAGRSGVTAMPLEAIVLARPDVLIMDWGGTAPPDQGTALLLHPALARVVPWHRHIVMPPALIACAGPALPRAIDRMAGELRRVRGKLGR